MSLLRGETRREACVSKSVSERTLRKRQKAQLCLHGETKDLAKPEVLGPPPWITDPGCGCGCRSRRPIPGSLGRDAGE